MLNRDAASVPDATAAQLHRFYLGLLDVVSSADDEQAGFHGGSTAAPTAADAGYNAAYYPGACQ